ncbi:MAG: DUF3152 domain-containing protein [Bifidobacteriaceae bacterium]|jgi:hypothetical protein|nr:DUF3152 domain-containing protein [Bifidobacteriaceae bacterium]
MAAVITAVAGAGLAVIAHLSGWQIGASEAGGVLPEAEPVTVFSQVCDPTAAQSVPVQRTVTYGVETLGGVSQDTESFARGLGLILTNRCGWARAGISFERSEDAPEMFLVLASPAEVEAAAEGCSAEYSCRVQERVLINDVRWTEATEPWQRAGLSLGGYRHMVVNHEVGHFLGFDHTGCPAEGQPAPLMQQQSKSLDGCTFNPWPLEEEITLAAGRAG